MSESSSVSEVISKERTHDDTALSSYTEDFSDLEQLDKSGKLWLKGSIPLQESMY